MAEADAGWRAIAVLASLMNLMFVMIPYYSGNVKSSSLQFRLFTWDASINELFEVEATSGYNYTNADLDIGNVFEVHGEVICFKYDLRSYHEEVWDVCRQQLFYSTEGWYAHKNINDLVESKADKVMALSSNRSDECYTHSSIDLSIIFTERLRLQEGDTAVFKNPERFQKWGKKSRDFFNLVIAGFAIGSFNCIFFFLIAFSPKEPSELKGFWCPFLSVLLACTMTFQWIATLVIYAIPYQIISELSKFVGRTAPELGIFMWSPDWITTNSSQDKCLGIFLLQILLPLLVIHAVLGSSPNGQGRVMR
jgi:hypothetical protein